MANNGHLAQAMENMVKASLAAKAFRTGSTGFFATGKIEVGGRRYQAQVMAVLIGSKDDPKAKVHADVDQARSALAALLRDGLVPAQFKSGKRGYRMQGKAEIGDQRFQCSAQAVQLA
ncbi:hypothetical protein [Actinomadura rupiterrae]|uniref:hypothetical protein n=1 Tax=Actinomadura rupiterrae TaxID=559627 RepID=UPI0020A5834A|nr:hypothetical protein [Actinomadura rupiterrae]MCP2341142.1 hypothetical protein [Actinomadura rupiterrae]